VEPADAGAKKKAARESLLPPSDFKNYNRNALALKRD
jgi:hypothetical protein